MDIANDISRVIEESSLLSKDIAQKTYISNKVLWEYKTGKKVPTAETIDSIAVQTNRPSLIKNYCNKSCPLGKKYSLIYMNGKFRKDGHDIMTKNKKEMQEYMNVIPEMFEIAFEKVDSDFTDEEFKFIYEGMKEALDVRHWIETLEIWFAKTFGIDKWEELINEHNQEYIDKNYVSG